MFVAGFLRMVFEFFPLGTSFRLNEFVVVYSIGFGLGYVSEERRHLRGATSPFPPG